MNEPTGPRTTTARWRYRRFFWPATPLASCPAVDVRTGAAFVQHGLTGYLVDRLPSGRQGIANEDDERALVSFLTALEHAQAMDRQAVRSVAAEQFVTERIVDTILAALAACRG